jgi:hypothetical protein
MTTRHSGYVVVLGEDLREDDAEATVAALRLIRGVRDVTPIVSTPEIHIAEARARLDLVDRMSAALRGVIDKT